MQRVANPDAAAMMKRNPTRAARRVQQRIENRPVSNCIRAVFHCFGLAKWRSDRAGVEMIAADRDRRFQDRRASPVH